MQTEKSTSINKSTRFLLILPMIFAFVLGLFLYKGLGTNPNQLDSILIGKPLPEFISTKLLHPTQTVSSQDMLGEPALINVWATWCPTCRAEHAFLNQLAEQYSIKIFGINYHDDREQASQWLQDLGNPYVFSFFDPRGIIGIEIGVVGAPETYLIDRDGVIIEKITGELNERTWAKLQPLYESLTAISGG